MLCREGGTLGAAGIFYNFMVNGAFDPNATIATSFLEAYGLNTTGDSGLEAFYKDQYWVIKGHLIAMVGVFGQVGSLLPCYLVTSTCVSLPLTNMSPIASVCLSKTESCNSQDVISSGDRWDWVWIGGEFHRCLAHGIGSCRLVQREGVSGGKA